MFATGETPMSAITSDCVRAETEAPLPPAVIRDNVNRREEEFRSALDSYIAAYVTDQSERRAITSGPVGGATRNRNFTIFRWFTNCMAGPIERNPRGAAVSKRLDGPVSATRRDGTAEHRMSWLAIQEMMLPTLLCLVCILIGLIA
jgi:hypothetical protein